MQAREALRREKEAGARNSIVDSEIFGTEIASSTSSPSVDSTSLREAAINSSVDSASRIESEICVKFLFLVIFIILVFGFIVLIWLGIKLFERIAITQKWLPLKTE